MSEEKLPSDLIDKAVLAAVHLFNTGKGQLADGFQPVQDLLNFGIKSVGDAMSIQEVVTRGEETLAQIKDYSVAEKAKTIEMVKADLNVSVEKAKNLVGHGYDLVFAAVSIAIELRTTAS